MAKQQLYNNEIASMMAHNDQYLANLVYHEGYETFFLYQDDHYKLMTVKDMEKEIFNFIRETFPKQQIRKDTIRDVLYQLEMLCVRKRSQEDSHIISFKDRDYDTRQFKFVEKDPEIFTIFHLPFDSLEINMPIPNFMRFIESSFVKWDDKEEYLVPDKELAMLVQEMLGFLLLGDLSGYRAWFLVGEGSNGKGVFTRVLENIFGEENTQSMTIQSLTADKYNAAEIIGKKINISSEDESKYIDSSRFKAIVAGDRVHTQVKFKGGFSFKPQTKFIFCANKNPTFQDIDYGIKRRLMFIPFLRIFRDGDADKDNDIDEKLKQEIPGIIKWGLEGAKRLVENDYKYTQSVASLKSMQEFEEDVLSAVSFVREKYIVDENSVISKKELYHKYRIYCDEVGKRPFSYINFKKQIMSNIAGIRSKKTRLHYENIDGYNLYEKTAYERNIEDIKSSFNETGERDIRPQVSQANLPIES